MNLTIALLVLIFVVDVIVGVVVVAIKSKSSDNPSLRNEFQNMIKELKEEQRHQIDAIHELRKEISEGQKNARLEQDDKLEKLTIRISDALEKIRESNEKKLDEMRVTVDEKLEKTLTERFNQSQKNIDTKLGEMIKGVGEMKALAEDAKDIKKIFTGIKTRGTSGEVLLESIISDILSSSQYVKNFKPNKKSGEVIEFAVKIPGEEKSDVYLPIDAKFPIDRYNALLDAKESGDISAINSATRELKKSISDSAEYIRTKYVHPPLTTDVAILYLPSEGLYAEVLALNIFETIQKEYKITIAGPTTINAILNSFKFGFSAIAIKNQGTEIAKILNDVRDEFSKYSVQLEKVKDKIGSAGDEVEKLITTRTNVMNTKLRKVDTLKIESSDE